MTLHKTNSALFYMFIVIVLVLSINSPVFSDDSTAVDKFGQLRVQGNKVVDKNGNPVMLRGMCLYWSQWKPQFYNSNCVQWLRDDWKCNVVRASMAVESGGYLTNPAAEKLKIKTVINACLTLGIYVIVDWHEENAPNHLSQSIAFFEEIARDYGDVPNLIYEIYNEPPQVAWSTYIKPYADSVVKHIRAIDPDNLIIVGTPNWSQYVDVAASDPLLYSNIAYTLHFYAASHKQWLRDRATTAMSRGAALFVTEFGTCESSGSGVLDSVETDTWLKYLEQNKISWCNWSIADLTETSAALNPGASGNGGWPASMLKRSGSIIRDKIRLGNNPASTFVVSTIELPTHLALHQNFPNPFNPTTTIRYTIPLGESRYAVSLQVFDVLGRKIAVIVNEEKSAGIYTAMWDAESIPSGVYFCRLTAGGYSQTMKMILIK